MKMSDVFYLPVVTIGNDRGGRFIPMESNQQTEAAAYAINQHDQLTAINQELVEALDHVINKRFSNLTLREYSELIKRAKELTNEG